MTSTAAVTEAGLRSRARLVLRNRTLGAIVTARFVSLTGTNMTVVALPWFVLATTGSTAKMGLVLACQLLPAALLGIPAGGAVAAIGPRRALVLCDSFRVPILAAVPILHWLGALSFPLLLVLVTAAGTFSVPYASAAGTLLPEVVGEEEGSVAQAQAALQLAIQTTGVLGPLLAGLLIPLIGATNLLFFDAASYGISAALVAALVRVGRVRPRDERVQGVLAGVRQLRRDALLGVIAVAVLIAHIGHYALLASLPALAFDRFHDARSAGAFFTANAAGSIVGAVAAVWLTRHVRSLRLAVLGLATMSAPIWLLILGTPFALVVAVMFVFGVGGPLVVAPLGAITTLRAPPAVRAQVVSAFIATTTLGGPIGSAGAGVAMSRGGFRPTYAAIAALLTLGTALLALAARRDRRRRRPFDRFNPTTDGGSRPMREHDQQVTQTAEFVVSTDPATAFELFEPVGESRWAHGWDPRFIYPASRQTQAGAVFETDHRGKSSLWTIAEYDRDERRIVYIVFVPGERVTRIAIDCRADAEGLARARVSYMHTALGEGAKQLVAHFTADHYRREMNAWQEAIEAYLTQNTDQPT